VYSDLFVAAPADADALARSNEPYARWHSVSIKGVLEMEWQAFAKVLRTDLFTEPLYEEKEEGGGRVILGFTEHVQAQLASMTSQERLALSRKWKWEAEAMHAWPLESVERVLAEVCDLAHKATEEGRAVLYLVTF
jgi:hypothetical protein